MDNHEAIFTALEDLLRVLPVDLALYAFQSVLYNDHVGCGRWRLHPSGMDSRYLEAEMASACMCVRSVLCCSLVHVALFLRIVYFVKTVESGKVQCVRAFAVQQ